MKTQKSMSCNSTSAGQSILTASFKLMLPGSESMPSCSRVSVSSLLVRLVKVVLQRKESSISLNRWHSLAQIKEGVSVKHAALNNDDRRTT